MGLEEDFAAGDVALAGFESSVYVLCTTQISRLYVFPDESMYNIQKINKKYFFKGVSIFVARESERPGRAHLGPVGRHGRRDEGGTDTPPLGHRFR